GGRGPAREAHRGCHGEGKTRGQRRVLDPALRASSPESRVPSPESRVGELGTRWPHNARQREIPELKLSVVMPGYNEARTIREIVAQVHAVPIEKEILIVDDGSTDATREILKTLDGRDGVRVFLQPQHQGKGAAVSV